MNLPIYIAKRYLFAKKTHNVINIISYVSVVGVTIGTLALVVVLSISNGFNDFIKSLYQAFDSDLRITVVEGKVFNPTTEAFKQIKKLEGVISYSEVLEENALLSYQPNRPIDENDIQPTKSYIATVKGVDSTYTQTSDIEKLLDMGEFKLQNGDLQQTVLGYGVLQTLDVRLNSITPIKIYIPKRGAKLSNNPIDAIRSDIVFPAGVVTVEKGIDSKCIFTSLQFLREMLDYTTEVTAIELKLANNANKDKIQRQIQELLGSSFSVKNRYQQNETLYRIMLSEKTAIYLILLFMLTIISFNIVGSLTMLMVDKKKDIATLQSMGASKQLIKRIFLFEGWLISLFGAITGTVLGLLVCWAQITFKLVRMPGGFLIDAYPVKVEWLDVVMVFALVAFIGYLIARIPVSYLAKRLKT